MIPRYEREPQRRYVERALRAHGTVATHDVLYELRYQGGRKCSITRLAAIVCTLRAEGWDIETKGAPGETAVYRVRSVPPIAEPVPMPPRPLPRAVVPDRAEAALPEWARQWRCADCGSHPASEPVPMLGDLGRAHCSGCRSARYFRRAA